MDHTVFETSDVLFEKNASMAALLPDLQRFRKSEKYCDAEIVAGPRKCSAHRVILAAAIPYFDKLFSVEYDDIKKVEIDMGDHNTEAIFTLIDFAYTGKLMVNSSSVESLLLCANFMQLPDVMEFCADFMDANMDASNVLKYKTLAKITEFERLMKTSNEFISKNFSKVVEKCGFLELFYEEFCEFIDIAVLDSSEEQKVYEAVMKWIRYRLEERTQYLTKLFSKVRLSNLDPEFLVTVVSSEPLIKNSIECRDILDEAKNQHLLSMRTKPAEPEQRKDEKFYVFYGSNVANTIKNCVLVYENDKWSKLTDLLKERCNFEVVKATGKFFVIGGHINRDATTSLDILDTNTMTWTEGPSMCKARSSSAVVLTEDRIYVCGGHNITSAYSFVEYYSIVTGKWKLIAPMKLVRYLASACVLNNCIYVLGGFNFTNTLNACERYCPTTNEWSFIPPMSKPRQGFGVAVLDGKIFAFGGFDYNRRVCLDSCEVYNPASQTWTEVSPMLQKRSFFAHLVHNEKIYVLGGKNVDSNILTMEEYCPIKNCWTFVTTLPESGICLKAVV